MEQRLKTLGLIGALLLLGFVGTYRFSTPLGWTLVPLAIGSAWMLGDPKRLLAGYWLWALVAEYVYQLIGLGLLRHGDKPLLGLLLIAAVFTHALQRKDYPELRRMTMVFWALMLLTGMSYLVNRGSLLVLLVTIVQYYRPFLLGYMAYVFIKPGDLPAAIKLFLASLLLQFFINLSWLLGLNIVPNPGIYRDFDWAVGTMGSSLYVGYIASIGLMICLAGALVLRQIGYVIVGGLIFASFVFTNTAHGYVFLSIMVAVLLLVYAKRPLIQLYVTLMAFFVLSVFTLFLSVLLPDIISLNQYISRGNDLLHGRKMETYARHITELPFDVPVFLLGAGPGNLGCAMANERDFLPAKYHGWGFSYQDMSELVAGSIISHTRTGLLSIWGDMGPIAFLLYWGAHVAVMVRITRAYRRGHYQNPWQKTIALALVPTMVLYFMVAFMTDIIYLALWSIIPWAMAGMAWTPVRVTSAVEAEPAPTAPAPTLRRMLPLPSA